MSHRESTGPYVYQPYGKKDKEHWKAKRLWGVGGVDRQDFLATIRGLTRDEAEAVYRTLVQLRAAQELS